jgi:hypothetical protein
MHVSLVTCATAHFQTWMKQFTANHWEMRHQVLSSPLPYGAAPSPPPFPLSWHEVSKVLFLYPGSCGQARSTERWTSRAPAVQTTCLWFCPAAVWPPGPGSGPCVPRCPRCPGPRVGCQVALRASDPLAWCSLEHWNGDEDGWVLAFSLLIPTTFSLLHFFFHDLLDFLN